MGERTRRFFYLTAIYFFKKNAHLYVVVPGKKNLYLNLCSFCPAEMRLALQIKVSILNSLSVLLLSLYIPPLKFSIKLISCFLLNFEKIVIPSLLCFILAFFLFKVLKSYCWNVLGMGYRDPEILHLTLTLWANAV